MKNMNRFERLAKQARREAPPSVDVSRAVIAILETGPGAAGIERASERPLMWLAALSSFFATATAVLAVISYNSWVFELSQAISWAMQ
ncbi:MAG: hypothetical protein P8Z79_20700 [Sedimentisphaerales bacterium]|jgi:hypothetical protein